MVSKASRNLILIYVIALHVVVAILVWQNLTLKDAALAAALPPPLCPPGCPYQQLILGQVAAGFDDADGTLYLLGDSILEGAPPDAFEAPVRNLGIRGDTTVGLRFRAGYYPFLGRARAALVHIGVNDVLQAAEANAPGHVKGLLEQLTGSVPVVLSGALPVDEALLNRPLNDRLAALNDSMREMCDARPDCRFMTVWDELRDDAGQLDDRYHAGDGIHLSGAGYAVVVAAWRRALGQLPAGSNQSGG